MAMKNALHKQLIDLIRRQWTWRLAWYFIGIILNFQWRWINLALMNTRTMRHFSCAQFNGCKFFRDREKKIRSTCGELKFFFYKFEARWRKTCCPHDLCTSVGECELVDCCKNLLKHQIAINFIQKIASARANAQITETKKSDSGNANAAHTQWGQGEHNQQILHITSAK